jgi:hypothetical protein
MLYVYLGIILNNIANEGRLTENLVLKTYKTDEDIF